MFNIYNLYCKPLINSIAYFIMVNSKPKLDISTKFCLLLYVVHDWYTIYKNQYPYLQLLC